MNGRGIYPVSSYPSYKGLGFGNNVERPKTRTEIDMENAILQRAFGLTPSGAGGFQGGIQASSLKGSLATGRPPVMTADGKKYTLQEDTQKYNRIMAGEREAARRSNRPVQDIMPMYRYVDEQGKPFAGTFLGGGSYGGFGGGGPQSSQRSWDNFVERTSPRNPDYGSNPRKRAMAEAAQQDPASEEPSGREGYVRNRLGYLEPQAWYNEDGTKMTESEYRKSKGKKTGQPAQPTPTMPAQDDSWRFSLIGGGPMLDWPYTNY